MNNREILQTKYNVFEKFSVFMISEVQALGLLIYGDKFPHEGRKEFTKFTSECKMQKILIPTEIHFL
jgi:hypothetical protein